MAQGELISDSRGWNREKDRCTHDFHHQAPAGQPGHGIRPHRHDGRGNRARRDLAAEGDTVVVKGVTLTVMHLNPTAPVTGTINAAATTSPSTTAPATPAP